MRAHSVSGRLAGSAVIVTGGARGIGAATVRIAAAEGAFVVIADTLDAEGEALARELGSGCLFQHLDVTNEAQWSTVVEAATAYAPLRGLVNNAGIYVSRPLVETDVELFERLVQVNQIGCFIGMKSVVPAMKTAEGGSIVNLSSGAGLRSSPRALAYSASKWAVRGMTKSAAIDLAGLGIRVNSVHPGPIDTPTLLQRAEKENQRRVASVPMGRSEEVARTISFLLSDESSYMTGAEFAVDGGVTVGRFFLV